MNHLPLLHIRKSAAVKNLLFAFCIICLRFQDWSAMTARFFVIAVMRKFGVL
jgi:hypothetical protein